MRLRVYFLACAAVFTIFLAGSIGFARPQSQGQTMAQKQAAAVAEVEHGIKPDPKHPILPIGAQAPDFNLPGVDGKNHKLSDYADAKVLVVLFESNHCPVMQGYEDRVRQITDSYKSKGVALVAINSNNPQGYRISELCYSDLPDTLNAMEIRASYRKFDWPYLYDGVTQETALKFGAQSTPHIFVFDQDRKLRYEGAIDDNLVPSRVKAHYATDAIDAVLAGQPVAVEHSRSVGCSTKWITNGPAVQSDLAKVQSKPVKLEMASVDDIKKLRANSTGVPIHFMLLQCDDCRTVLAINFWSLKCKECLSDFDNREYTNYMYRTMRPFQYVNVSTDNPKDSAAVLKFLQDHKSVDTNLQINSADAKSFQEAFGLKWKLNQPFMVMIGQDGQIIYQKEGAVDEVELRRVALAHFPDDSFPGQFAYWNSKP